jgi:hypothetical protein
VEDETTRRASAVDRHLQRVGYELGAHVLGERPAHNLSRRQIDDGGQVRPPLPGGDVGDVTDIAAVDDGPRAEGSLDQVEGRLGRRVRDGGLAPPLLRPTLQARLAHQPAHPAPAARLAPLAQGVVHSKVPVGPLGLGVDRADLLQQLGVGELLGRWRRILSFVERRHGRPRAAHSSASRCGLRLSPPR